MIIYSEELWEYEECFKGGGNEEEEEEEFFNHYKNDLKRHVPCRVTLRQEGCAARARR